MKLAFIGIGNVGFAIANNLQKKGYSIIIASNNTNSDSVAKAMAENPNFEIKPLQEAIDSSDLVFLAIPFKAIEATVKALNFDNKTIIDCTNPVGMGISHGLNSVKSGSEQIQEWLPKATIIKAFTIYGFENLVDSSFPSYNTKPMMMIAGNDKEAKSKFEAIVTAMGFEMLDTGNLDQALHLEHMTLLWVKMVRRDGHQPKMVWGKMEK